MQNKTLLVLALVALLSIAAPTGTAQMLFKPVLQPSSAPTHHDPIPPGQTIVMPFTVNVQVLCSADPSFWSTPASIASPSMQLMGLAHADQPWLQVRLTPHIVDVSLPYSDCSGPIERAVEFALIATVAQTAPAFAAAVAHIEVQGPPADPLHLAVPLKAGFGGTFRAILEESILLKLPAHEENNVHLLVDARTNGPIELRIGHSATDLVVDLPTTFIVPAAESVRIPFTLRSDQPAGALGSLTIDVQARSADAPITLDTQYVHLVVHTLASDAGDTPPDIVGELPAPGLAIPLLLVGLLGVLRRRLGGGAGAGPSL